MTGSEKTIEIPEKEFLRMVRLEARVEIFQKKLNREYKNVCMIRKEEVAAELRKILKEENEDVNED